ncbi:MAG: hypothetical protein ACFNLM_03275 [Selenomonas noxia]
MRTARKYGHKVPAAIQVRNLKNISVDIPLHKIMGIAAVSGSAKSSLALGVLYAEGSRRYIKMLSTYTWRRVCRVWRYGHRARSG